MALKQNLKLPYLLAIGVMAFSLPLQAQDQAQDPNQAAEDQLMALARQAAAYAGAARYCSADEDLIDEYIAKTEARLKLMAKDEYERVLAQVEFKNQLTAASAKEPTGGCKDFVPVFEAAVKKAR